jgi:hypothetical protein
MRCLMRMSGAAPHFKFSTSERRHIMADTSSITDKIERKKVKRASRKKAAPKAPRTGARGESKAKVKKASRGTAKR